MPSEKKKCARTVCQNNAAPECVHSDGSGRVYCIACAALINRENPEWPNLILGVQEARLRRKRERKEKKLRYGSWNEVGEAT